MLDYQGVYRKDHKENLRIFSDLKAVKEISTFSNDLNRAFGENSYNYFHKHLTEPKQIFSDHYFNVFKKQDNTTTNKYKLRLKLFEDQNFNLKQFQESLANMKLKEQILNEKIKHPYIERMKNSSSYLFRKELQKQKEFKQNKSLKSFFSPVPDVGRYNPKYSSINKHSYRAFFGNVPTNRFYTIEQEIVKNDKNKNISEGGNDKENFENISHKIIIKNNLFNRNNNISIKSRPFSLKKMIENDQQKINDSQNLDNSKILKENKSDKSLIIKNSNNISHITDNISNNNSFSNNPMDDSSRKSRNNSSLEIDKNSSINRSVNSKYKRDNNHSLKFEAYTSRKPLNKTIIYNTDIRDELPNYYTSKYIKNNINFNRNRNIPNYIEQAILRDQNPPLGFYQPKYDLVFNNLDKNVYINKKNSSYLVKNHLKKIFCDYNVSKDFKTVPALNNEDRENEILKTEVDNKSRPKFF